MSLLIYLKKLKGTINLFSLHISQTVALWKYSTRSIKTLISKRRHLKTRINTVSVKNCREVLEVTFGRLWSSCSLSSKNYRTSLLEGVWEATNNRYLILFLGFFLLKWSYSSSPHRFRTSGIFFFFSKFDKNKQFLTKFCPLKAQSLLFSQTKLALYRYKVTVNWTWFNLCSWVYVKKYVSGLFRVSKFRWHNIMIPT